MEDNDMVKRKREEQEEEDEEGGREVTCEKLNKRTKEEPEREEPKDEQVEKAEHENIDITPSKKEDEEKEQLQKEATIETIEADKEAEKDAQKDTGKGTEKENENDKQKEADQESKRDTSSQPIKSSFTSGFFGSSGKPSGSIFGSQTTVTGSNTGSIFGKSGRSIFDKPASGGSIFDEKNNKSKEGVTTATESEEQDKETTAAKAGLESASETSNNESSISNATANGETASSGVTIRKIGERDENEESKFERKNVETGEENEEVIFSCLAKLYALDLTNSKDGWRERGIGTLRVNRDLETRKTRVVMRSDAVLRVILNVGLNKGIEVMKGMPGSATGEKVVRITGLEDGKPHQYAIKAMKAGKDTAARLYETLSKLIDEM